MKVAISRQSGKVLYTGVLVDAGSREDPSSHPGMAHFVEHTMFKGTERRSVWQISNRMESIGGEINAYTSKEATSVYTISPAGYEERGVELISDLVSHASFPAKELEKEREVIIEEINSYLDNPADSVFDKFEEYFYQGSSLANNILGTVDSVRAIGGADCRDFTSRYYTPDNMVGFISGPLDEAKTLKLLERHWGRLRREGERPERVAPAPATPFDVVKDDDRHQAHTIVGARLFSRNDQRRFALMLLNNYIGGPCTNSRLNQELRERRGLVYTVESFLSLLSDTGLFAIYFGTDKRSVDRCLRVIRKELETLAQTPLTPRKLDRLKEQYCGQLLVSSDNRESMAMSLGKNLLYYDKMTDVEALAARLWEVSADEIQDLAQLIISESLSRLTLM